MRHLDATRSAADARLESAAAAVPHEPISVRIAGVGLLTALGLTAATTWDALLRGEHVTSHSRVPLDCRDDESRAVALALRAAREAIDGACWGHPGDDKGRTAVLIGTSKGPVESWLSPPLHIDSSPYIVGGLRPDAIARIASAIGQEFQLTGPRLTLSAACASGLHALIRAALMLRSGEADRALVVASESSLHPLFQATFKRLGVLASPDLGCRPFDQSRDGFLLSESAAAVCLEAVKRSAADHSEGENANRIYVERFALGGDATHLTSSDPTGSTLRRLLQTVINDRPLDLVHAHGTATVANDEIEIAAIESCIPSGCSPALYSHKGALGHSLGAAGLVSIVINCISHRFGVIPPNVQTRTPLPTRNTVLSTSALRRPVRRSIAIAAGFGGPVAVVGLYAA